MHAAELIGGGNAVVLAGDYNVIPTGNDVYKPERWVDDALFRVETREAFGRIVEQGWVDAIRHLHPDATIYTFWDYFRNAYGRDAGLRIDHLLLNAPALKRLKAGRRRSRRARVGEAERSRTDLDRAGRLSNASGRLLRSRPRALSSMSMFRWRKQVAVPEPVAPAAADSVDFLVHLDKRYRRPLTSYFEKRIRESYDIDDLVQEVFIRLAHRPNFSDIEYLEVLCLPGGRQCDPGSSAARGRPARLGPRPVGKLRASH